MRRLKYLGTAHRRILRKGENFNGRLTEPLKQSVVFELKSGHIAEVEDDDVASAIVELDSQIIDVSDYKVAPSGGAEELYRGVKPSDGIKKNAEPSEEDSESDSQNDSVPHPAQELSDPSKPGFDAPRLSETEVRTKGRKK